MIKINQQRKTYLLATIYAVIMGLSFLFVKISLNYSDPLNILAHRFSFAFIFLLILKLSKKVDINVSSSDFKSLLPISILYPTLFFTFQTFGLLNMSSSEAGIILATVPVFTLILAKIFLKEESTMLQKLFVILSVLGVIYIMLNKGASSSSTNIKGIIFMILAAISLASYNVVARIKTKSFKTIDITYIMTFVGFIVFNIIAIINNSVNGDFNNYINPLKNFNYIIAILYLGILSSVITSLLSNYVLSKIDASKMSVFANLGTVITIFAGVIILKEDLFYYHIIGTIMIVAGVIGTNIFGKKK